MRTISYEQAVVLAMQSYLFWYASAGDYGAIYLDQEDTTQEQVDEYFRRKARAEREKQVLCALLKEAQ